MINAYISNFPRLENRSEFAARVFFKSSTTFFIHLKFFISIIRSFFNKLNEFVIFHYFFISTEEIKNLLKNDSFLLGINIIAD
jgi:hypothetical protein